MGRNVDDTSVLDKKITTYSNPNYDLVAVGISLTATVTAVLVEGEGWVDFIGIRNASASGGFSTTDTQATVYIDGQLLINTTWTTTYFCNPVHGQIATDGTNFSYGKPLVFDDSLEVRFKSVNPEASYSLSLMISYGAI